VTQATIAAGTTTGTATCPSGKSVFGGGVTQTDNQSLVESGPVGTTGWKARFASKTSSASTVYAYCG
jgi:hypothetical protein